MVTTKPAAGGDIPVLLLPGLDGTGRLFEPMVRCAPSGFLPLPIAYPATLSSYEELAPIVRAQQPDGHWIIVAESFSGPLAVQLAAARPPGLAGLVLVATSVRWSRYRWLRYLPLEILLGLPGRSAAMRWLLLGRSARPELVAAVGDATADVGPRILASRLRAFARADVADALRSVDVPILYLQAANDRCLGEPELESVLYARPDVEWRRITGPHLLLQTQPRKAWAQICDFVRSRCSIVDPT